MAEQDGTTSAAATTCTVSATLPLLSREPDKEQVFLVMVTGQIESGEVGELELVTHSLTHSLFPSLSFSFLNMMSCIVTIRLCQVRTGLWYL